MKLAGEKPCKYESEVRLTGIIRDVLVIAFGASRHMPAKRLGSAGLNRRHYLELAQVDMPGIGPPPRGAIPAEDISDFQR
jgi:hypothetical protein